MSSKPQETAPNKSTKGVVRRLAEETGRAGFPVALIVLLGGLMGGVYFGWQQLAPSISARQEYQISPEHITITPAPDWLLADIKSEVIREGSLDSGLSIADPKLANRLIDAFTMHPCVKSVTRVSKQPPSSVSIELVYRKPVAAIVVARGKVHVLAPVDAEGVRLPSRSIDEMLLRKMPRIVQANSSPEVGQPWSGNRIVGACQLALFLEPDWEALHLADIVPSMRAKSYSDKQLYTYELITDGRTHILWGAAPNFSPKEESSAEEKLARLKKYIASHGELTNINSPQTIDVRNERVKTMPRVARKPETEGKPR